MWLRLEDGGSDEKWLDLGCVFKVKPPRFQPQVECGL